MNIFFKFDYLSKDNIFIFEELNV